MKKSVIHASASSGAAFNRSGQLSLRRLHSGIGAARHGALRGVRLPSAGALREPASKADDRVYLTERSGANRRQIHGTSNANAVLT